MSSPLLPPFTIPPNSSRWLSLYLDGTDALLLLVDGDYQATDGGAGLGITVTNGYGPRDAGIPYPYTQPVPLILAANATPLATVRWSGTGSTYTLGAVDPVTFDQSGDVWIDMRQAGDYLGILFTNSDLVNTVTVSLKGVTS